MDSPEDALDAVARLSGMEMGTPDGKGCVLVLTVVQERVLNG